MQNRKAIQLIGRVEVVYFPDMNSAKVPARIDTGARTSAIWASNIEIENEVLKFKLFAEGSDLYTGEVIAFESFDTRVVTPSNGISEERYMVKLLIKIGDRNIRASFTLADRSTQKYPVLVGRNILRGKFVVDVKNGNLLSEKKKAKTLSLRENKK